MTRRCWVPGRWPSANQALALKGRERQGGLRYSYEWWAREARGAAMYASRIAGLPRVPDGQLVCVWIWLVYHTRYDPDGWTIAGKWFVDGLAQGGVIRSDRRDVYQVGGRCFATVEESDGFLRRFDDLTFPRRTAGALIELAEGVP